MKILLVSSFFPPTHTAGTEKRTLGYAKKLQGRGHEVRVVCAGTWDVGERFWNGYVDETYRQILVRRINLNWALAPDANRFLYDNPVVETQISQWLAEWKPDIVHVTSCLTLSASVLQAAKDQQVPVVLTLTDYWFICPKLNLLRSEGSLCDGCTTSWDCLKCLLWDTKAYRGLNTIMSEATVESVLTWVSKHPSVSRVRGLRGMALDIEHRKSYLAKMIDEVDIVTAPSACLRDIFSACGVTKSITVIHSGHELTWLETPPKKKSANLIRIGYVGQIIPVKGVHILLSAFVSKPLVDRAQLSIFGDFSKDPDYSQQLESLRTDSEATISFNGAFPHERLGDVLSEIDVLVVPSQWHENNPRVIQEAFASKTPVIASKVGGISEFVQHEINGLLFERGDVDDLAKQLSRIVDEPGLLQRLQVGVPPIKTIDEEVAELEEIYGELTAPK